MKKSFIEKVIREGIVDTKKYRYVFRIEYGTEEQKAVIERIPINYLDTTAVFEPWERVWNS